MRLFSQTVNPEERVWGWGDGSTQYKAVSYRGHVWLTVIHPELDVCVQITHLDGVVLFDKKGFSRSHQPQDPLILEVLAQDKGLWARVRGEPEWLESLRKVVLAPT